MYAFSVDRQYLTILCKFICVQCISLLFHRKTLPIMTTDRVQIHFRKHVSTGTEPHATQTIYREDNSHIILHRGLY